ncbi:MAG: pyruvate dehydrogenase (acetyl-transferring), homodimeric type, partial [Pseudomonadota bacterium]
VIWGSYWDPLLARDNEGHLQQIMMDTVDGEYQNFKAKGGAYTREHFFGKHPATKALVSTLADADIWRLNRGGHDPHKVYAAYHSAVHTHDRPTVILAKTVKGYGMGESGEGTNATHQQKKMALEALKKMRTRFEIPLSDEQVEQLEYIKPAPDSPEMTYLHQRRRSLGGFLPARKKFAAPLDVPKLGAFQALLDGSGEREMSTTMAFVRILNTLVKDKQIGKNVVPIVPDEARTFGMEGMFRQLGIYSSVGQLYEPQDRDQIMYYKEDKSGQILEEGINEAGAMSSWVAAATAYSTHGVNMVPFYIYYSMFGFQRIGDLAWMAGDMRARGFMLGGTAGRTTLNGEGLQHEDGHSHVLASTIPNCVTYDPCYAYELAVIIQHGLKRMYQDQDDVYHYITVMNENYVHPPMPEGSEEGIIRGIYKLHSAEGEANKVQLLGSGTILREVIEGAKLLKADFGVDADVFSVTSFNELARDGAACQRYNMLNPDKPQREPWVAQVLDESLPTITSSDYIRAWGEQIRPWLKGAYTVLGTDGYGRSDTREKLREFFEVNRFYVVVAALHSLAEDNKVPRSLVGDAMKRYTLNGSKPDPMFA